MRGNANELGAISHTQVLELALTPGAAQKAFDLFIPQAIAIIRKIKVNSSSSAVLALLSAAVERRQPEWTRAPFQERHAKRQRVSENNKTNVVFAAKLVQNLVKTYATTSGTGDKEEDLKTSTEAMDLACVALYVVCALEHTVQLEDLVVDNLLYQVTKKYANMPNTLESATCVAACVHIRLWTAHSKLSKGTSEQLPLRKILNSRGDNTTTLGIKVVKNLKIVADLPPPNNLHTAQFARLLLGHAKTCILLLAAIKDFKAVLQVTGATMPPWISHLQRHSGQDANFASSFSDQTFRILWKIAAVVDIAEAKIDTANDALQVRLVALSFVLKCSNYTSLYYIQQIHRVGVQHERSTKKSRHGLTEIYHFYCQAAIYLSASDSLSTHMYSSESYQWGYILWLEHFAVICELSDMHLRSAMVLENAVQYVQLFKYTGRHIEFCLALSIAAALLSAAGSKQRDTDPSLGEIICGSAICKNLGTTGKMIRDLVHNQASLDEWICQCEMTAQVYLKKLKALTPSRLESMDIKEPLGYVDFISRSIQRSATKIFNHVISAQQPAKYQLYHHVISSFGEMCKAIKGLYSAIASLDTKLMEMLILEQSRLHRMIVTLSVRFYMVNRSSRAENVSQHINSLRAFLSNGIEQGLLTESIRLKVQVDIDLIARECYSCASHYYKKGDFQESISVLLEAFELGKSYSEHVMCRSLNVDNSRKTHAQLKMDAIALLLAHCFHKLGNFTNARLFTGYSIMYCGDILESLPQASITKYVSCILEEVKLLDGTFIIDAFKTFVNDTTHVMQSRLVCEDYMIRLWREIRDAFNRASARIMVSLRGKQCTVSNIALTNSSATCVHLCGELEHHVNEKLMEIKMKTMSNKLSCKVLLNVHHAMALRNQIFCTYYAKRAVCESIQGLLLVNQTLTDAAESLLEFADATSVDFGGIYGWRGVVTIEMALMNNYVGSSSDNSSFEHIVISEEDAVADIKRSLNYWGKKEPCGLLFDGLYAVQCLESICNALSLISCAPLEMTARGLLKTFQLSKWFQISMLSVVPSPLRLLDMNCQNNALFMEAEVTSLATACIPNDMQLFEKVDGELCAAKALHLGQSRDRACLYLLTAVTTLGQIKLNGKNRQTATVAKAIGMREVIAHTILSDIYFTKGQSKCAITEAKSALRVCWKMVKKFTALSSPAEATSFELPPEISPMEDQERNTTIFSLHFMTLECSSWDLLVVAKVLLCRLSSLYSLSDQPHRAALYVTEAMRLVGGLNLRFFRRSPFYDYAELELHANHLEKAKVAVSLINPNAGLPFPAGCHCCMQSDSAIMEQSCDEIVQQGDVYLNESKHQEALAYYSKAIDKVNTCRDHWPVLFKRLGRVRARCWRKVTRLQSQTSKFSDSAAVETLLDSMKKLKRSLKSCAVRLEQVKGMLELGRTNVRLLRSVSPRAFTSLRRTQAILEEAYLLGSHLGISHLNYELRNALGMAYFAEMEETARDKRDDGDGDERAAFLSWASCALLTNGGFCDGAGKEQTCFDTVSDTLTEDALKVQLERLAASPRASQELAPRQHFAQMARGIAQKVQQLPDNWIIVSLMIGLSSELVVTRVSTTGSAPMSFCLPNVIWKKCMDKMAGIVHDSRALLSGHTAQEASVWNTERKRKWWNTRTHLDKRVEETIVSMQQTLGFWRCLLVGGSTITSTIVQRCWSLLTHKACSINLAERNKSLLGAIADAQQYLSDSEVIDGLKHVAEEIDVPLSDAVAHKVVQVLRTSREDSASKATYSNLTTMTTDMITKLKVGKIKQLLAAEGLSTDGIKTLLVKRLVAARDAALIAETKLQTGHDGDKKGTNVATVLILNHQLQLFPWEGMDIMGLCSGVTRMPSLDLIVQNFAAMSPVRRDRVRFVLNPAGDLKSTETRLGPILERGGALYGWEGIKGKVPSPNTISAFLLAADVYVYCGHGSGETYLHRDKVLELKSTCSAALLFGCSSGRLEREGIFGPSGAVLSYLRAGSPAVLAMLWDVTDRDIDQLSCKVMQEWLLDDKVESLAQVLQTSRGVCKLKYLNGHAAICYGLPLHVAQT